MTGSLLDQGFSLLTYGIGVVFAFLTILVFLTLFMSKIVIRFFPEPIVEAVVKKQAKSHEPDTQVISAISAAVHKFRKDRNRK